METERKWRTLWTLFASMLSISACTFGGGFVIVTFMRRRFVEELHWLAEDEMLDLIALAQSSPGAIAVNAAILVGWRIGGFLGMLAAGLGNRAMTCDAVGPAVVDNLLVTRHMIRAMPRQFADFRPVAAVCPGVLARTGMEALELVRGAVERVHPAAVIAVDALAARDSAHLCATVQLSDAGLTPGSGVGNHRKAVDAAALGVPVIALGVPTVIDGAALCGQEDDAPTGLFVTPRDIDSRVRELGRLIGRGLTLALQPGLSAEEVAALLG